MRQTSALAVLFCLAATATAHAQKKADPPSPATAAKIASARSAAPAAISANATIADMTPDGKMTTLAKGTNGWLCLPDDPSTPAPDPMCVDKVWQQWFQGYMSQKPPAITQIGVAYMLLGGSDASNTDPYAKKPAAGELGHDTAAHDGGAPRHEATRLVLDHSQREHSVRDVEGHSVRASDGAGEAVAPPDGAQKTGSRNT